MDLAEGHVAAVNYALNHVNVESAVEAFNLGTGRGYSVLQMIDAMAKVRESSLDKIFDVVVIGVWPRNPL